MATGDTENVASGVRGDFYARSLKLAHFSPGYQFKFPAELQIVVTWHFYAQNIEFDGISMNNVCIH